VDFKISPHFDRIQIYRILNEILVCLFEVPLLTTQNHKYIGISSSKHY